MLKNNRVAIAVLALILLLSIIPGSACPKMQDEKSDKACKVVNIVKEGVRSECGTWRPSKEEKIYMPDEVKAQLKVGDHFYFVWRTDKWIAEIRRPS